MPIVPTWCNYHLIFSDNWTGDFTCLDPYLTKPYYNELFHYYDALPALSRSEAQESIWNFVISKECIYSGNGDPLPEPALDSRILILIAVFIFLIIIFKES